MAARPRCVLTLFGMGLRRFSMSPGFVPTIKELIRATDLREAREIARRVLKLKTVGAIRGFLTRRTKEICASVAFLDLSK
jgi:phosphotransferase system enzyme I (PtsI)